MQTSGLTYSGSQVDVSLSTNEQSHKTNIAFVTGKVKRSNSSLQTEVHGALLNITIIRACACY